MSLLIYFFILFLISLILLSINLIFSIKKMKNREKYSSFECGFDPMSNSRLPFNIHFFLISLMFLIFDLEISILIPLIFSINKMNFFMILTSLIFMFILIFSIYIEYMENMIEWKII